MKTIIETERLIIRRAEPTETDIEFFYRIWTDSRVMTFVGFPNGLKITRDDIRAKIEKETESEYNCTLIVQLKATGKPIGECKLGTPDKDGIAGTDVKLLPDHWGHKYGVEVKRALVDYLFAHTDCVAIKATPNKKNIASIKMQEAVGGERVGEETYRFPESMRSYTCDIPLYIYLVRRRK